MKICIIGGGSTYTPELIDGLIAIGDDVRIDEICLLDIAEGARKLKVLSEFASRMLKAAGTAVKLSATFDPEEAIAGSDYILNQFRAGLMHGRINDEKIPLLYGLIGQETTGMGGMANGLRAMPFMEKYVDMARRLSNNAWIINFTNPSGMLTEFLINYLGYKRCIGLCNCPIGFIMQAMSAFGCERDDVFLLSYGLNHLSWVDKVYIAGTDMTDEFLRISMQSIPDLEYQPDFMVCLKMLPNPYLRYYYNTGSMLQNQIAQRDAEGTRGEVILKIEEELLELYAQPDRTRPPAELSKRGGYMYSTVATELLRSLATDDSRRHIVNTFNNGTLKEFPDDYVMEIPVVMTSDGPKTIELGSANKATIGLISTIKNYERLTIEGYLKADESLIKQAMLIHPLGPDEERLNDLWSDLKRANIGYFPCF